MFYVSNISGALVPFEPGITPLNVTVPTISSVPGVTEVLTTPITETEAVTVTINSNLAAPEELTAELTQTQDAAVYDGHAISTLIAPTGLADSGNIGRAGAVAAYQTNESISTTKVQSKETISRVTTITQADSIDDKTGQTPYRVNPIKNYRRNPAERKQVTVAADIMSSPVFTIRDNALLEEAQKVFKEHKFRHIPVVSATGKLVGIISDRDFIGKGSQPITGLIKSRMVTNILTAHPQTEIPAIAEAMINHHIGCLPIVDEVGTLVGILTRTDILHAIVNHAPIELWT